MSSIYTSFNIAQQSLLLNQSAINIVSTNISNMDTEGYSKQRLNSIPNGSMKINGANKTYNITAGAQIGDIQRYRDQYLDTSFRDETAKMNYYSESYNMASSIESAVNEFSGSGLQDALTQFYTSMQTLNSAPGNSTYRVGFVTKAQVLCTQLNQVASTLEQGRTATVGSATDDNSIEQSKLASSIKATNDYLTQIAEVNTKIVKSSLSGSVPNDLLDQRDKLLDQVSQYIPISTKDNANGSIDVSMNGMTLVKGTTANQFKVVPSHSDNDPSTIELLNDQGVVSNSNINSSFTTGKVGAYLDLGSNTSGTFSYKTMLNQLNTFASEFANAVNSVQQYNDGTKKAMGIAVDSSGNQTLTDFTAAGGKGVPKIFTGTGDDGYGSPSPQPITAATIKLSDAITTTDPVSGNAGYWKIAAARTNPTAADFDPKSVGNGDNISAMYGLNSKSVAGLGGMDPSSYLTNAETNMGSEISSLKFNATSETSLYNSANTQRESAIGVNMDEELVDLVKYQRAYEASARIFSTSSEILKELVNLGA